MQRDSSIEDQVRKCREFAEHRGWLVAEDYVRFDEAISAASLVQRVGLQSLIEAAKQRPRPFDRILIEDSSRLARNLEDALRIEAILRFNDVFVTSVSQGFDSQQKFSRQLLTLHGMMDEQFLVGLADKVHRGQEGRTLKGLLAGGRCYGYRNVPIEDHTRTGKYGRPAVSGVALQINDDEAAIVRRIFQLYADGAGLAAIAKKLNADRIPAPQPPRTRQIRAWAYSSIYEMLRNERYRGVLVWNRSRKERNPETGRKTSRPRPESEWVRVDVPEWRIVSEELWQAVHKRTQEMRKHFGAKTAPGLSRGAYSRYLFSGLLTCGECGAKMVIVSGSGLRGYAKYGCPSHRYRGTCSNALMIRYEVLEQQMLAGLEQRVLKPEMVEYAIRCFQEELEKRLKEVKKRSTRQLCEEANLRSEKERLRLQAANLADAIAANGHSPTLLRRLGQVEQQVADIDGQLAARKEFDVTASLDEIREFVTKELLDIRSILREDVTKTKLALRRHIRDLVLTPKRADTGRYYQVSGTWELLPENHCVLALVARDGIEPPPSPENKEVTDSTMTQKA
jgi:DNA invertase Pin-like site-specific DNA recombinase